MVLGINNCEGFKSRGHKALVDSEWFPGEGRWGVPCKGPSSWTPERFGKVKMKL